MFLNAFPLNFTREKFPAKLQKKKFCHGTDIYIPYRGCVITTLYLPILGFTKLLKMHLLIGDKVQKHNLSKCCLLILLP
jgi:hypothetical protein